jgi:hypothetical protein
MYLNLNQRSPTKVYILTIKGVVCYKIQLDFSRDQSDEFTIFEMWKETNLSDLSVN